MKHLVSLLLCISLTSCATFQGKLGTIHEWLEQPQNQQNIRQAAQVLATAVTIAAPFVTNKDASAALSAAAVVATAYGNQGVPTSVLAATTQSLDIARQIVPLVGGNTNSGQAVQIIDAAAAILNASPVTAVAAAPSPN